MKKGWTNKVEKLLIEWAHTIILREKAHRRKGLIAKWGDRIFTMTGIISNISSVSLLTSALSSSDYNSQSSTIQFFLAVSFSTIVSILQGLETYLSLENVENDNIDASKSYVELSKYISSVLALNKSDREPAATVMSFIREKYDNIMRDSPELADSPGLSVPSISIKKSSKQGEINIVDLTNRQKLDYQWQRFQLNTSDESV